MAELEWEPMEGGHTSGLYRIAPLDDGSKHHLAVFSIAAAASAGSDDEPKVRILPPERPG